MRQRIACNRCLAALRPGDTLKFTKIDRTGRSLAHLVDVTMVLSERGVNVVALDTGVINTHHRGAIKAVARRRFAEAAAWQQMSAFLALRGKLDE